MCKTALEDYNDYYNELNRLLNSREESFIGNGGHGHNSVVMRLMLENSDEINMFCGSCSVFSEPFFDEIANTDSKDVADALRQNLSNALTTFLNNGGRLNIILENYSADWASHIITGSDQWLGYMGNGQINVNYIPDILTVKKNVNHVAFNSAGSIERLEMDKNRHLAICRLNSKESIEDQKSFFSRLTDCSVPIPA